MPDQKYRVKVNGFEFVFTHEEITQADTSQTSPRDYNLIHAHQSVNGKVLEADPTAKNQLVEIEGETFCVQIQDELDQVLDQMGFTEVAGKQVKEIKAPMPGLVLEVNVTEGQQVLKGDKLLILVAMKMENSIFIHADALIKKVSVNAGQPVEKGQVLVEIA